MISHVLAQYLVCFRRLADVWRFQLTVPEGYIDIEQLGTITL